MLWQFHCDLHICLTCIGTAAYPDIHAMGVCRAFQEGARKRLLECHCISTQPCPSWTATYHCQSLHCSKSTPGSALFPGHDISVLCCAVLCCAVLCCAVLCCAVLCCAVLCCAVLCCAVLCCAVLFSAMRCSMAYHLVRAKWYAIPCCAALWHCVPCQDTACCAVHCPHLALCC